MSSNSPGLGTFFVRLGVNDIDFFQTSTSSFWIEEEDDWDVEVVDTCEEQVSAPTRFVDEDWWLGESESGEKGLFPSNYVTLEEQ